MARKKPDSQPLEYISADLRTHAVPLPELFHDPRNARKHDRANLDAIQGSLQEFGQVRAAVYHLRDGQKIVIIGNGMLAAAKKLGWSHLAAIEFQGSEEAAIALGIADNRTAELADWDDQQLQALYDEINVGSEELQTMFADLWKAEKIGDQPTADTGDDDSALEPDEPEADEEKTDSPEVSGYRIIIEELDAASFQTLIAELRGRGYQLVTEEPENADESRE